MSDYNYERFDEYVQSGRQLAEFSSFSNHLHAGEVAPDFTALHLDRYEPVRLSDVWRERTVVLEFGSFT